MNKKQLEDRIKSKATFCKSVSKFLNTKKSGQSLSGGFYIDDKSLSAIRPQLKDIPERILKLNLHATFTDKQIRRLVNLVKA